MRSVESYISLKRSVISCGQKVNGILEDVGKGENKAESSVCKDPPCSQFPLILQDIEVLGKFQKKGC